MLVVATHHEDVTHGKEITSKLLYVCTQSSFGNKNFSVIGLSKHYKQLLKRVPSERQLTWCIIIVN